MIAPSSVDEQPITHSANFELTCSTSILNRFECQPLGHAAKPLTGGEAIVRF
jgi:hypothetical protein